MRSYDVIATRDVYELHANDHRLDGSILQSVCLAAYETLDTAVECAKLILRDNDDNTLIVFDKDGRVVSEHVLVLPA